MKAFHGDAKLRAMLIEEVKHHREQDQIIQGSYGKENGQWRGCAVGCSIHSLNIKMGMNYSTSDHSIYPQAFGVPEEIAHLQDAIFESLPIAEAVLWPERFWEVIQPGADLSMVNPSLFYWMLTDDVKPTEYPRFQPFIDAVVDIYEEWTRTGVRPSSDRADRDYRADLADLADRTDRAYRAYLADRADRSDLAYLADRTDLIKFSEKLLELLASAPVGETQVA